MTEKGNLHEGKEGGEESLPASTQVKRSAMRTLRDVYESTQSLPEEIKARENDLIGGITGLVWYGPFALVGMFGRLQQQRWHGMVGALRGQKIANRNEMIFKGDRPKYEPKNPKAAQGASPEATQ